MATTTMHFGPEWMRAKPQTPARHQPPPSPPLPAALTTQQSVSTYSALVTPAASEPEKRDESRPFRYTKEEMLRIYREGGGRGGLGLEVERWEGIVRDVGSEPAGLREMGEAEKKLFAGPLNSELRRRQSTDLINTLSSQSDRSRLNHPGSSGGSPMRERFSSLMGRRRESTDQPPLTLPRKLSLSGLQGGPLASRESVLPSPRSNRMGSFGSGFDGVLNSGDTWTRRRPSGSVTGAGGSTTTRGEGREDEVRGSGIREEEEDLGYRADSAGNTQSSSPVPDAPPSGQSTNDRRDSSVGDQITHNMSLEPDNFDPNPPTSHTMTPAISGPPPGLLDPTNVEWSYLDPQGQVQGPFRADVMQKWFDDGYFTADLLMKRMNVDIDWIAVGELERRVGGGKIFLSQLPISAGPPGLTIHTDSPQNYSPIHEQSAFNGYQPVPTRNLRAATLDSYLNNASPSESSIESFAAGRFGNGSPDPSVFGGRAGNNMYSGDPSFGTRGFGEVRAPFQDQVTDPRSLNNVELARAPSVDTFNNGGVTRWPTAQGQMNQGFGGNEQNPFSNGFNGTGMIGGAVAINQVHGFNQEAFGDPAYSGMGSLADHHDSPLSRPPVEANGSFGNNMLNGLNGSQFGGANLAQYAQSSPAPYAPSQQHQSVSPFGEILQNASESPSLAHTPASVQPHSASPWTTELSTTRRPRTFDAPAETSPVAAPDPQGLSWATSQPLPSANDPSPWLVASVGSVDDVWKEIPGPNSLTFSNVGQHNKLQQQEEETEEDGTGDISVSPIEGPGPTTQQVPAGPTHPVPTAITVPVPSYSGPVATTTPKTRRKSTVREVQGGAAVAKAVPPPPPPPPPPRTAGVKSPSPTPTPAVVPPKAAWATEDEKKLKPSGASMSLREIQESEVKKVEARKAIEKERERVARANAVAAVPTPEESQASFTASWGLPTSQAGTRTVIPLKEVPSSSSTPAVSPGVPVWTNSIPAPATKKTMKEIQEEEERKKRLAVKESMASAAARRAYAETTVKVTPSVQAGGGAWTMVGANGKSNAAAVAAPRPAVAQSSSTGMPPAVAPRANGGATRALAATVTKAAGPPRVEELPVTPSQDFLKWLTESLKGLNSSVNLEDITSMLLSFPLDPDPSTIEIISDLIYANSTTLNGRRFATEYVSKRKADAAARRGTTGTSGGKPISIADVVKTQPKPVQQEWGFKVVNKKKKGGRA